MPRQWSIPEQEAYLEQVEAYRKEGLSRTEALEKLGISQAAYYSWKRRLKARNCQVQEDNSLEQENKDLLALYQSSKEYISELEKLLGELLIERELEKRKGVR